MNTMDDHELWEISDFCKSIGWDMRRQSMLEFIKEQVHALDNKNQSMDDLPRSIPRHVDSPEITAQDIVTVINRLGLRYRVGTTTASDTLIVEGRGMLTVHQAIDWLRTGVARYACEEISGTTYRIALETLLRELGVKYE